MAPNGEFDLWYSRPTTDEAVRLAGSDETDESFNDRRQFIQERNKVNSLLNIKSKQVGEGIHNRLWTSMYLQYLVKQVNNTSEVKIVFSDQPDIGSLSMDDRELHSSTSAEAFAPQLCELPLEFQISLLEQRQRDACIGTEVSWATLRNLTSALTSGKVH
jgi:hypothetical protein